MSVFFGESRYSNNSFGYVSPYQYERQRIMEESRRRRAEMQYRKQLEERERRRRAAVLDYQRRLADEAAFRRKHQTHRLHDEDTETAPYYIVRGPDGCLYRVLARHDMSNSGYQKQDTHDPMTEPELHEPIRGESSSHHASNVQDAPQSKLTEKIISDQMQCDSKTEDVIFEDSQINPPVTTDVVVEDASDDEEEKELKSVWRNRRPSSGILMEPVDAL